VVLVRRKEVKEKVSRISFSLQPSLQTNFERIYGMMGYEGRSKALQIAVQNFVNDFEAKQNPDKFAIGTILILYEHDTRNIDARLTDIGHEHRLVIVSSLHLHLDEKNCLNIMVVKGKIQKILELEKELRGLNGIKQIKYSGVAIES
jgi:CopG family transcriptional regulator, nickel-responsive regulator